MGKLMQMKVLIMGLKGVGVETAKNLILAGPESVTLLDDEPAQMADLGTNFFLTEAHVAAGTSRAVASATQLSELNEYVQVRTVSMPSSKDSLAELFSQQSVVLITDSLAFKLPDLIHWNHFCRERGIGFIIGEVRGLAGRIFVDFGPKFSCFDTNGEECKSVVIAGIAPTDKRDADKIDSSNTLLTVFTHSDKRHPFQEGDAVKFREVRGLPVNDRLLPVVKVLGPYSFIVRDTNLPSYVDNHTYDREGVATQVKIPTFMSFKSLEESNKSIEDLPCPDLSKFGRSEQMHLGFLALAGFTEAHHRIPGINVAADEAAVVAAAKGITLNDMEIDEKVVGRLARFAACEISPMTAFAGGIVAQEIVKFTGKFGPLKEPLYFDMFELVDAAEKLSGGCSTDTLDGPLLNSRYAHQIAIFGRKGQEKLEKARLFLVGAGALGCEFLKAFACMGIGAARPQTENKSPGIIVTDMDRIETSNLNRQFLFRKQHVGNQKSLTAASAAKQMNPALQIQAMEVRVGPETEDIFDDPFWEGLSAVVNALDNIQARLYVDSRCVWFDKPLLESGTLGTKANVQVVLPGTTQSYGDSQDPPEESIPLCTLKHFPHAIEHTIEWSRDIFQGLFVDAPRETAALKDDPVAYLAKSVSEGDPAAILTKLERMEHLMSVEAGADSASAVFQSCIQLALDEFSEKFDNSIQQLLFTFPIDHKNADGQHFWSGPKRAPKPIAFNSSDPQHMEFVTSAANLFLAVLGRPAIREDSAVQTAISHCVVNRPFHPKGGMRIKSEDSQNVIEGSADDEERLKQVADRIGKKVANGVNGAVIGLEFEKDDDSNFHIDFIHACSNLRARNYSIPEADKHRTKMIAGKIIPAVATTTAMVVGLVTCELLKLLLLDEHPIEMFKNAFVNLGLPLWILSEPLPPVKTVSKEYDPISMGPVRAKPEGFTPWNKLEVRLGREATLKQFLDHMQNDLGVETMIVSAGNACLYNAFMAGHKPRLAKRVVDLIEEVTKKPVPASKVWLPIEVSGSDAADGADLTIPTIKFGLH